MLKTLFGSGLGVLIVVAFSPSLKAEIVANSVDGRFIQVDIVGGGGLIHASEIRALSGGTNVAFGASVSGTTGGGHGSNASLVNHALEGGAAAWTRNAPGAAIIDLGGTATLQSVIVHQRNDGCCQDRLTNVTATVFADDGGSPGAVVGSANFPGQVGNNSFENLILAAGNTIRPGGDGSIGTETVGNNARFVRVQSHDGAPRLMHIGEIEAFADGSPPNGGAGLSTNELAASVDSTQGTGGHGADANLLNNVVDGGGNAWTRSGIDSYATIDVGATTHIGTIRAWQRGDGCCQDRLSNFTVSLLADDGSGNPGAIMQSQSFAGNAPNSSFAEFTFADNFTIGSNDILEIEIDLDAMTSDLLSVGASGTGDLTIEPGATLNLFVSSTGNTPQVFDVLDFGSVNGSFDNINIFGRNPRFVDLSNLLVNGQVTITPEPASMAIWLLLSAAFGAYVWRRRK